MFRLLLQKYVRESRLLWLACGFMLFVFPWMRIWTISQFELSGFAPLMDQIRSLEKFSPVPLEQFLTYEGVVALTFDEPILILCIVVWSIARGSDVVSGEIGRGSMELLLSQPISRLRVMLAHGLVSVMGLFGLVLCSFLGLCCGLATNSVQVTLEPPKIKIPGLPFSISSPFGGPGEKVYQPLTDFVNYDLYVMPSIHLFGLGLAVFGLSVFVSSFDRYRWRTIGIVLSIYVLQLLLFILAKSMLRLNWLKGFSFLSAYQPDWTVQVTKRDASNAWLFWFQENDSWGFGPLGFASVLIMMGLVLFSAACVTFTKRDIPAPL